MAPSVSVSGAASGTSVRWIGWAMVSIPSSTTPSERKNEVSAHMIQPVIALSRRTSAVAAATTPTDAAPPSQSQTPQPTTPRISRPFSATSVTSMIVKIRISRWNVARVPSIASRAWRSSRPSCAKSLTEWMLV